MSLPKKKVAIVGAGIGGLTAAALLAGYADVHVYERDQRPGGKVRQVHWGNRSIDCGPTVFTLKGVFDDIFERCGERLEDYVDLKPLDILARHAWPDGSCLDLYADQNQTYDAIEEFAGRREADAYLGFLRMAQRAWETVERPFIRRPEPRLSPMVFSAKPEVLLRLDPYLSFWRSLSRRFKDERLRQLFGRYATYCGSSPFKAPSTLALIAYIEQQGVWSLSGGMHALADALVRVAEKRGAQFHYGSDISQLLIASGEIRGVEGSGEERSDVVVFNGDGSALRAQGAISDEPGDAARTPSAKRTQSAVTVCFTGQASGLKPSVHNVLFSNDYEAEFDDVFDRSAVPEQPTVYVFAPDADDQTTTSQRYFCLMNAPADGDRRDYTEEDQRQCQSKILNHLSSCGLHLNPEPESLVTTTPEHFAQRYPGTGGALFGRPIHGVTASFKRPGVRTKTKGLYRAGGSVHPGSGVPMAALSGLMAARAIISDYGLTPLSQSAAIAGGISMPSAMKAASA